MKMEMERASKRKSFILGRFIRPAWVCIDGCRNMSVCTHLIPGTFMKVIKAKKVMKSMKHLTTQNDESHEIHEIHKTFDDLKQ